MKIPFDITKRPQIESGDYKVFAHEHEEQEARIVCWDNKGEYPIVALVDNEPEKFDKHGRVPGGNRGGEFSLFLVTPEEEPSEFEQMIENLLNMADGEGHARTTIENTKRVASELLALALKELKPEIDAEIAKAYMNADEVMYRRGKEEALKEIIKSLFPLETDIETLEDLHTAIQKNGVGCYKHGFEEGKKVALKDLPRWENNWDKLRSHKDISGLHYIVLNGKAMNVSDLTKLPGFKDE